MTQHQEIKKYSIHVILLMIVVKVSISNLNICIGFFYKHCWQPSCGIYNTLKGTKLVTKVKNLEPNYALSEPPQKGK